MVLLFHVFKGFKGCSGAFFCMSLQNCFVFSLLLSILFWATFDGIVGKTALPPRGP